MCPLFRGKVKVKYCIARQYSKNTITGRSEPALFPSQGVHSYVKEFRILLSGDTLVMVIM
jgi:hypothetical protein